MTSAGQLAGRRALVTGGSLGIGRAIAARFVAEGAAVAIGGRRAELLEEAAAGLGADGGTCVPVVGDVAVEADAERIVAAAAEHLGGLDLLVNNAAVDTESWGKVHEWSVAEWDRIIAIDLRGPFLVSRAAIPHLLEAGGGAILHISSVCAVTTWPGDCAYGVAKAGLNMLSDHIAVEYGPQGIRSNTLMPGVIRTEGLQAMIDSDEPPPELAEFVARHPVGRFGEPDEVAVAAVSLCAAEPGFMTGANVPIDGGYSRV